MRKSRLLRIVDVQTGQPVPFQLLKRRPSKDEVIECPKMGQPQVPSPAVDAHAQFQKDQRALGKVVRRSLRSRDPLGAFVDGTAKLLLNRFFGRFS